MNLFQREAELLNVAKNPDSADNFEVCAKQIGALYADIPLGTWPDLPPNPKPRVAFYLPTSAMLAHVKTLETLLSAIKAHAPEIDAYMVVGSRLCPEFVNAFQTLAVSCYVFDSTDPDAWTKAAEWGRKTGLDAFVHVSSVQLMAYASKLRCARKHVWWSMKWHASFPHVDGYFAMGNPGETGTRELRGATWQLIPAAFPELARPELASVAMQLRATLPAKTVYGTFARDEKYSAEFLNAVARILDANPDAMFVYASRQQMAWADYGSRVKWLGWLGSDQLAVWIQAIDVMLDPFPFAGGHVSFDAMANKTPIAFFRTDDPEQPFPAAMMERAGWTPLVANDADDYVGIAGRMPRDFETYRAYNLDFYEQHLRDESRMAREFTAAVRAIL